MKRTGAKYLTLVSSSEGREEVFRGVGSDSMPVLYAKPNFWIRTVAGPKIGFGHMRRSMTLARMLNDIFHPVFICDPDDGWTQKHAAEQGWGLHYLESPGLWTGETVPSALLVDTREKRGLDRLVSEARKRSVPVLSIHDLGLNPLPSDIAVDGSIFPATQDFPRRDTAFYIGTAYLILDPTFGLIHQQRKRIRESIQSVLVNLGGGDSRRFYLKVLEGLRLWDREIEVIGMPGFSDWGQKELLQCDWAPLKFRWAGSSEAVERLLFRADLAITAGGIAAFEAMCAGTPLLALAYDGYQNFTVSMLAKAEACIDLGQGDLFRPASLPQILTSLETVPGQRERLSFRGRQIVDGRGAERVSRVIRRMASSGTLEACPMVV